MGGFIEIGMGDNQTQIQADDLHDKAADGCIIRNRGGGMKKEWMMDQ